MSWKSLFLRYYSKFYATLLHVRDKNYHLIRKLCKNTSTRSLSTRMLFQKRNDNTFSSTRDRRYTYSFARYHPKFFQFPYNLTSNDKIIRHVKIIQHDEEKKNTPVIPLFPPLSKHLGQHTSKPLSRERRERGERGEKEWSREERRREEKRI